MKHNDLYVWVEYNNSIISAVYSEEKKGYILNNDNTMVVSKSEIKPIRLDDSRISNFRISPPLSETNEIKGTESKCFLEESFDYNGKQRFVFEILREGIMEYVEELQKYLIKQGFIVMGY